MNPLPIVVTVFGIVQISTGTEVNVVQFFANSFL
jgi:hypothetical protein